jgi:hypothetical protein
MALSLSSSSSYASSSSFYIAERSDRKSGLACLESFPRAHGALGYGGTALLIAERRVASS